MMLFGMQNSENNDPVALEAIENLIGKTRSKQAVKPAVIVHRTCRMLVETADQFSGLCEELVAQAGLLVFVPIPGSLKIAFGA